MYMNFPIFHSFLPLSAPNLLIFLFLPLSSTFSFPPHPKKVDFFLSSYEHFSFRVNFFPPKFYQNLKMFKTHFFCTLLALGPIKRRRSQLIISFGGVLTFWGPLGPELWTFQTFLNSSTDINSNSASHNNNISNSGGFGTYFAGGLPPPRPPASRGAAPPGPPAPAAGFFGRCAGPFCRCAELSIRLAALVTNPPPLSLSIFLSDSLAYVLAVNGLRSRDIKYDATS